jgi:hypothetical protein
MIGFHRHIIPDRGQREQGTRAATPNRSPRPDEGDAILEPVVAGEAAPDLR